MVHELIQVLQDEDLALSGPTAVPHVGTPQTETYAVYTTNPFSFWLIWWLVPQAEVYQLLIEGNCFAGCTIISRWFGFNHFLRTALIEYDVFSG